MLRPLRFGLVVLLLAAWPVTALAQDAEEGGLPSRIETLDYTLQVDVVTDALENPWAIDFLDAQTALVTEQPGDVHLIENGRLRTAPVAGIPEALHAGQGGMLDVAVDPDYAANGWIYLAYSHAIGTGDDQLAMTRVVRGRLSDNTWTDEEVLFEAPPDTYLPTRHHYGTRIVFDPAGHLYFAIGDRGRKELAQDLSRPNGKIHRIGRDGSIPDDNPFVGREDALPSIYSYGHRNPQGLAVHPATGAVWAVEHGPRGGDELNRIKAGANYGWPVITYGINYDGTIITRERTRAGMEQPVTYWRPSIAVSGLDFYAGAAFPYWQHHLLVGALREQEVRLLNLAGERVQHQEVLLKNVGRVREAVSGPDGAIYVVLNAPGAILRLSHLENRTARAE